MTASKGLQFWVTFTSNLTWSKHASITDRKKKHGVWFSVKEAEWLQHQGQGSCLHHCRQTHPGMWFYVKEAEWLQHQGQGSCLHHCRQTHPGMCSLCLGPTPPELSMSSNFTRSSIGRPSSHSKTTMMEHRRSCCAPLAGKALKSSKESKQVSSCTGSTMGLLASTSNNTCSKMTQEPAWGPQWFSEKGQTTCLSEICFSWEWKPASTVKLTAPLSEVFMDMLGNDA